MSSSEVGSKSCKLSLYLRTIPIPELIVERKFFLIIKKRYGRVYPNLRTHWFESLKIVSQLLKGSLKFS